MAGNWRARQEFARRREWLEADFFREAAGAGKPRGLRWVDCRFDDPVTFAVDPRSGRLNAALVGVTIQFEAIEGGGMEDVEAVSNLRMATAVFRHDGQQWFSQGRAVFNLSPVETVQHLHQELKLA